MMEKGDAERNLEPCNATVIQTTASWEGEGGWDFGFWTGPEEVYEPSYELLSFPNSWKAVLVQGQEEW